VVSRSHRESRSAVRAGISCQIGCQSHRLAVGAVGFADTGEHVLKGKTEPQRLWRATRVLAAVGGSQRVDGLEAPLTGRDAELRAIRDLFHAAAERRVPRLVLVSGRSCSPGGGCSSSGWRPRTR
jgi:hypothetical protein